MAGASRAQRPERGKPNQPSRHIVTGACGTPALAKYDPAENSVTEHHQETSDDDRGDHLGRPVGSQAAIYAGLFIFSRGHRRLLKNGRTCRRGHLEKEYLFHDHTTSEGKSGPRIRLRFARARLRQDH